jgi:hypothetical protein
MGVNEVTLSGKMITKTGDILALLSKEAYRREIIEIISGMGRLDTGRRMGKCIIE